MKRRTRVVAWIYLLWSLLSTFGSVSMLVLLPHMPKPVLPSIWVSTALWLVISLQWIAWGALLKGRQWGWYALIAWEAFSILFGVQQLLYAHILHVTAARWIRYTILNLSSIGISLWILLTDKPSGWNDTGGKWNLSLNDLAARINDTASDTETEPIPRFAVSEIGFPPPPFKYCNLPDDSSEHLS